MNLKTLGTNDFMPDKKYGAPLFDFAVYSSKIHQRTRKNLENPEPELENKEEPASTFEILVQLIPAI